MYELTRKLATIVCLGLLLPWTTYAEGGPLIVPDNGTGTVDMPPLVAQYTAPDDVFRIIDGLPPGTAIELTPLLYFHGVAELPGGSLGGTASTLNIALQWNAHGTGDLAGFNRFLALPVTGEWHWGPRTTGDPVQSFDADAFRMQGQIIGDPDFDLLRITAGTGFGMPSPGHTTLTQLPGGDFWVDSFFDITYRIDFVGNPGSRLAGKSGSTTGTIRMQAGEPVPEPSTIGLLATGLVVPLLGVWRRRRRKA